MASGSLVRIITFYLTCFCGISDFITGISFQLAVLAQGLNNLPNGSVYSLKCISYLWDIWFVCRVKVGFVMILNTLSVFGRYFNEWCCWYSEWGYSLRVKKTQNFLLKFWLVLTNFSDGRSKEVFPSYLLVQLDSCVYLQQHVRKVKLGGRTYEILRRIILSYQLSSCPFGICVSLFLFLNQLKIIWLVCSKGKWLILLCSAFSFSEKCLFFKWHSLEFWSLFYQ